METPLPESPTQHTLTTLESEVCDFASSKPYWGKFIAAKILSGDTISDDVINTAYNYLLADLSISPQMERPNIEFTTVSNNSGDYKPYLLLKKLTNVEGVNALSENETIEFTPNVTIVYGANGSGKSGYVRLLKKVFYSKSPEDIIPNIHAKTSHKEVSAEFIFESNGTEIPLKYPNDKDNIAFGQFAVFDGKSVIKHLDHKNEFDFRPAGLSFFAAYTNAISRLEVKLNAEISRKQVPNTIVDLFEGDSDIKTLIQNLSDKTKLEELKKYFPLTEEDGKQKKEVERKYDDLLIALKGKEKEIKHLQTIKDLLTGSKQSIETLNNFFISENLLKIKNAIEDCLSKEANAKAEGIEKFKVNNIEQIGSPEWKDFILAAEKFANLQKSEGEVYPDTDDSCLLCHQPLSNEARTLILNYWAFIKSVAEQNAKEANQALINLKNTLSKLNFDLFPEGNALTIWLKEQKPTLLETIKSELKNLQTLRDSLISDIDNKAVIIRTQIAISVTNHESMIKEVEGVITRLQGGSNNEELEKLLKEKTRFIHREKLELHFSKIEVFVDNCIWVKKAATVSWSKRNTTDMEKYLSGKYFNQKYIDNFNIECSDLNGHFGIGINHTGSAGTSYRQLTLKGKTPSAILSEGEQKVIALADFLSEIQLSEVNRGIIFDDPVSSLDENRKSDIAIRLIRESTFRQVVIFTHDLVFVSQLISNCDLMGVKFDCHWVEVHENTPGKVWLKNAPSFEKAYKKSGKAQEYYVEASKLGPEQREDKIKNGFAALRTSYESFVVFDLFAGVVQRFNERVSVDSLGSVYFTTEIRDELLDSFYRCCRYMEGHSHSDKYSYKKPTLENLNEEIQRFNAVKKKLSELKKPFTSPTV